MHPVLQQFIGLGMADRSARNFPLRRTLKVQGPQVALRPSGETSMTGKRHAKCLTKCREIGDLDIHLGRKLLRRGVEVAPARELCRSALGVELFNLKGRTRLIIGSGNRNCRFAGRKGADDGLIGFQAMTIKVRVDDPGALGKTRRR